MANLASVSWTLILSNALKRNTCILPTSRFMSNKNTVLEETETSPHQESLENKPAINTSRTIAFPPPYKPVRQIWVENMNTVEEKKLGIMELHPDVFGAQPRIDLIHDNVVWQRKYRFVNWEHAKSRAEMRGGGRKPWPQKGLGKARHGSIRSPLFINGGIAHGPRSPRTYFYMLPFPKRVMGLAATLSVKLAQNDLRIVDSLEIPTDDPKYIEDLMESRTWGLSVLFVDDTDIMPTNITMATDSIGHVNLMPVYGLNVYSMLKHETLVLTMKAAEKIEEKLLFHMHRTDDSIKRKFKLNQV